MRYDGKLETAIINGINITHNGETICERSYSGNWTETRSGAKEDRVTDCKYDVLAQFRLTVLPTSPHLMQIEAWARARQPLTFQWSNGNTGEVLTSTTAYLETIGSANGSADREFNITCEHVS